MSRDLICIVGPTGVGKSALALRLARHYGTAILSADARQIYRYMDIGTAKPTPAERAAVPHDCIDILDPDQPYNASRYEADARACMASRFAAQPVLIMAGGSTLYVDAIWRGLDPVPAVGAAVRAQLRAEWEAGGLDPLLAELAVADPVAYARIDRQNPVRVLRALEVWRETGQPISVFWQGRQEPVRDYRLHKVGIDDHRDRLYARIDARVDAMLAAGLVAEVQGLLDRGYDPACQALQSIGYREVIPLLQGQYDLATARALIQRNSRRYAKRQLTYYRSFGDIAWFRPGEDESVIAWLTAQMAR
ncbi:MAG: tRNA (adenosine(37)-N6)-dimethylallyltransferase MiaA [Bacteroidia bacterium]